MTESLCCNTFLFPFVELFKLKGHLDLLPRSCNYKINRNMHEKNTIKCNQLRRGHISLIIAVSSNYIHIFGY